MASQHAHISTAIPLTTNKTPKKIQENSQKTQKKSDDFTLAQQKQLMDLLYAGKPLEALKKAFALGKSAMANTSVTPFSLTP